MSRLIGPFFAVVAALSASGVALAQGPFGAIRIGANRSKYAGACPVEVIFTGNINLNLPHPNGLSFNYYWVRSDGAKGPVNVVHPPPTQRLLIIKEPWRLGARGRHYDISVKLFVNSGNTHLEETSQVVPIDCK